MRSLSRLEESMFLVSSTPAAVTTPLSRYFPALPPLPEANESCSETVKSAVERLSGVV